MIVLSELARDPTAERYGYDVAKATGLASGTLYPILVRLEKRGLLEARWELGSGRPRHVYRLTVAGLEAAQPARGASAVAATGKEALA